MESIQEAERQLNQLNEIRTVVDARNDAATMATYAKVCIWLVYPDFGLWNPKFGIRILDFEFLGLCKLPVFIVKYYI